MYKFIVDNNIYTLTKILDNVIDFNYNAISGELYIINSEHKMCSVNITNHDITHINYVGCFNKIINNTKSANNLYKSMC